MKIIASIPSNYKKTEPMGIGSYLEALTYIEGCTIVYMGMQFVYEPIGVKNDRVLTANWVGMNDRGDLFSLIGI